MMDVSKFDMPDWVNWVAQDPDGAWWGYECEPLQHDNGWYENEVGRNIKLQSAQANARWHSTLRKIQRN
ncbi:hypothetical protein [Kaarinaea lacus]